MFCTKCGAKLPEGAKFCTHCGCPTTGATRSGQTGSASAAVKPGTASSSPSAAASDPKPRSATAAPVSRASGAPSGVGSASAKTPQKSKKPGLAVVALLVCAVLVGGVFLLKGSGKKAGSGEGNSTGTGIEDTGSGAGSSAGADQAEAEVSDDAAGKLVDADADSVAVKIPAITEADFGNGFYDTYSMYYGGTPAVIEDANGYNQKGNFRVHFPYTSETGEQTESYIAVEWKQDNGVFLNERVEISADLYEYFIHDLGMNAEEAEQVNQDLSALMPIQCRWVFDDDEAIRTSAVHKLLFVIDKIWADFSLENSVGYLIDALYRAMEMENVQRTETMYGDSGLTTISPMQSGALDLNGNGWIFSGEHAYYPKVNGEQIITNQPTWTANMEVDPEDIVGKLQVQKDENGNITLVHLYNDTACYDYRFNYDENGLLWTYEYYEYPKGQKPEAVGPTETREYVYDVDGKLYQANSYHNETGSSGSLELTYDEEGRIIEMYSYTDFQGSWGSYLQTGHYDTIMETYEYDDAGKVCRVSVQEDMTQGQDTYMYSPTKMRIYTPVQ